MSKLEKLMKDVEFIEKYDAAQSEEEIEALLTSAGAIDEELTETDLDDVSGGSALVALLAGLGVMAAKNITPRVVADATIINSAYVAYKVTGKSKYIKSKSVSKAESRMKAWSNKNSLSWSEVIGVITSW